MPKKLINEFDEDTSIASSDLLLLQKSSDNTHRKITAGWMVPYYSLTADNFDYTSTGSSGIWWEELGRTTLTTSGDLIEVESLPNRKYLKVIISIASTGTTNCLLTFNNDSTVNYAARTQDNGAADATQLSTNYITIIGSSARKMNVTMDITNYPTQEKTIYYLRHDGGTAGAANAPPRQECAAKWCNTTDYITSIQCTNTGVDFYDTGAQMIVLGHN